VRPGFASLPLMPDSLLLRSTFRFHPEWIWLSQILIGSKIVQ
jgi:hypothetical protein